MKVYLAGPMRGIKDFNFPAFDAAAAKLRAAGILVFNPAEHDREVNGADFGKSETGSLDEVEAKGFSLRDALKADTSWICDNADAVAVLPGWENSKGAIAEVSLAKALGLEVYYADTLAQKVLASV